MGILIMGIDLGQAQDYTALCIIEKLKTAEGENEYHLRYLERLSLGTPYPAVVKRIAEMLLTEPLKTQGAYIVVDSTGVGRLVVDLMRQSGLYPVAVAITAGSDVTQDDDGYKVPKRDLVSTLQVLLQSGRLKIAEGLPEARTLIQELLNFRVKISMNAHDTYGAWREGVHDDLVLAVALACWLGENMIESIFIVQKPRELGVFEI